MKRGNVVGRLLRIEAEAEERGRPNYATMSEEERYYRFMLILAKVKRRTEEAPISSRSVDTEGSRRRVEEFERMRPRLEAAEAKIDEEAKRVGLSKEECLRRRFPWVNYSERSSRWR